MAEILGIEIVLENKTKVIITCYCVGILGLQNAEEILKGVRTWTLTNKKSKKMYSGG